MSQTRSLATARGRVSLFGGHAVRDGSVLSDPPMLGFDGDPSRAAALLAALDDVLAVFPEHLAKPPAATSFDSDARERDDLFEAILRAHKRDRLLLPIQALRATGAERHGFSRMPLRRFAWFVPSLLASWLARAPGHTPFGADDLVAMLGEIAQDETDEGWTDDEATALEAFFERALDAAISTPLSPPQPPTTERPLEEGVRVWSHHSPSLPLDVLRVARAFGLSLEPLVIRWALDEPSLALDHLLEAVFDTITASKHFLSHEAVADRLGEAFFEAEGERARRLSKAEATVRRNITRRGDY